VLGPSGGQLLVQRQQPLYQHLRKFTIPRFESQPQLQRLAGLDGPEYTATRVLIIRGQAFISRRWGFTLSGNLQRTPDYRQRGLAVGVISRW